MDQLRAITRVVWQQRFWVLVVLGPLIAAVCWMMASGKLQAAFTTNKGAINGHFTSMQSITSEPVHGNDDVNAKERAEAVKISQSVRELWKRLYDSQREQVLKWPATLGEEFLEFIETKKFGDSIPPKLRNLYLNYIKNQFDALVEIVDAKKMEAAAGEGMPGIGAEGGFHTEIGIDPTAPGVEKDYLVDWLDQSELRQQLDFEGAVPSARKVWVTQEDLWVYETLLNVIKKTNDARGATRSAENAAIRVIVNLDVGKDAAGALSEKGNIIMPAGGAGEAPMGEIIPDMGEPVFSMDGEVSDPGAVDAQLLANRYVDPTGVPIPDGSTGTGVEYRRLPIRMSLIMDQRWIPRVLVECANATLPIEVQRLRINPEMSGAGFEGALSSGGGGGPEGGGGFGGSFTPSTFGGSSTVPVGLSKDFVTVEIQGLVYIYNQPSDAELTVPGAEDAAPPAEGEPSNEVALQ